MTMPVTPDAGSPRTGPSLQRRVSRFTLLMVSLAVLVTGLGAYGATRISVDDRIDAVLLRASTGAVGALGPSPSRAEVERYVAQDRDLEVDLLLAAVRADGSVVTSPGSQVVLVDGRDRAVAQGRLGTLTHAARTTAGSDYRVRVVPLGRESGTALVVGRPLSGSAQILGALALALVCFGAVAVAAAGLVARHVARAGVAPVRKLTAEVEERAAAEDLTPVRVERDDEIGRLAVAFNHLLETITVSRVRQARFVADAGHELRTP